MEVFLCRACWQWGNHVHHHQTQWGTNAGEARAYFEDAKACANRLRKDFFIDVESEPATIDTTSRFYTGTCVVDAKECWDAMKTYGWGHTTKEACNKCINQCPSEIVSDLAIVSPLMLQYPAAAPYITVADSVINLSGSAFCAMTTIFA